MRELSRTGRSAPTGTSTTSASVGAPAGSQPEKEGDDMASRFVIRTGKEGSWGAA